MHISQQFSFYGMFYKQFKPNFLLIFERYSIRNIGFTNVSLNDKIH